MNNTPHSDRDLRQRQFLPPAALAQVSATVVGVGAIGRQVALQLAAVGVPTLQLIDHDVVEPLNLASQGYLEADVGRSKVTATAELCRRLNSGIELITQRERFRRSGAVSNHLFCCVDSITTRGHIWRVVKNQTRFFCDTRMSGEALRVVTAADATSRTHYPTTLFGQDEAFSGGISGGGGCTSRGTIYSANIAAGLALSQFSRHLRRLPVDADLQFNLLSSELSVTEGSATVDG